MSESKDYKKLRENVLQPRDRMSRIENLVAVGMPDINYCIEGCEGWIELKNPTEPKRQTTRLFGSNHKLSQDQMNWFLSQRNAGGVGWILIATDIRWMLVSCFHADEVNELTVNQLLGISEWNAEKRLVLKKQWENLRCILKQ